MARELKLAKHFLKREGIKKTFYRGLRHFFTILPSPQYPKYLFDKYIRGSIMKPINNNKMVLDLRHDKGIAKDLYFYGKREIYSTNYLLNENIIKEGDAVLDIGGNIGYYALMESQLVGDTGCVYALEPVESNFKNLEKNIKLNSAKNIYCYKLAAGDKNQDTFINISKKGNWSSLVYRSGKEFFKKEPIKVVLVDEFLKGKRIPKLVRMDVEGYEYAIIEGMRKTLEFDVELFIEIHPLGMTAEQMKQMFATLKEKNYHRARLIFDPLIGWFDENGNIKPSIKRISKKIGDDERLGGIKIMSLDELFNHLVKKKKFVHAFISKRA